MSRLSILLALGVIFSWGVWSVLAKIGIDYFGPFRYLFYSQIIASALIIGFILIRGDYRFTSTVPYGKFAYPVAGGVISGLAVLLLYVLMSKEPGSIAVSLTAIYPIVTIVILVFILRVESMSVNKMIGALLAVIGAFLLSL